MSAGGVALDDEAVHVSAGFSGQRHGERGRGDDAEELRTFDNRERAVAEGARVERGKEFFAGQRADDINFQLGRFAVRQPVQRAGNGARNAGAHEHVIHVGEHRAVKRGQGGQLDFFEKIDADQSVVAFLGQEHFHEVGHHRQFHQRARRDGASAWARV